MGQKIRETIALKIEQIYQSTAYIKMDRCHLAVECRKMFKLASNDHGVIIMATIYSVMMQKSQSMPVTTIGNGIVITENVEMCP